LFLGGGFVPHDAVDDTQQHLARGRDIGAEPRGS
jgi:hypothetical protein